MRRPHVQDHLLAVNVLKLLGGRLKQLRRRLSLRGGIANSIS